MAAPVDAELEDVLEPGRDSGRVAGLDPRGHQLLDEERQAAGPGHDPLQEPVLQGTTGQGGGQGNERGPHDVFGPGTRVPTLLLSPRLRAGFVVDTASHDTTAIAATIEHRFGLRSLGPRDAAVRDYSTALAARAPAAGVH